MGTRPPFTCTSATHLLSHPFARTIVETIFYLTRHIQLHSLFVSVPLFAGVFHYVHCTSFSIVFRRPWCECVCVSGWFVFWSSPVRRMSECMHGRLEGVNALSAEGNDRGVNLLNSLPASLYFRASFNFALMEWHFATNSQEVHRLQRPKIIKWKYKCFAEPKCSTHSAGKWLKCSWMDTTTTTTTIIITAPPMVSSFRFLPYQKHRM